VHLIKEIESSAERLPESFKVQVLRKLDQARRGIEAGLDMTGVLDALAKRVEEIKKRCGIKDDVARPASTKVFNTPYGPMLVDETEGIVEVAGVRFTEKEIGIMHENKPGRASIGLILSAKRIFEGRVVR
jgi:hypothetical protein